MWRYNSSHYPHWVRCAKLVSHPHELRSSELWSRWVTPLLKRLSRRTEISPLRVVDVWYSLFALMHGVHSDVHQLGCFRSHCFEMARVKTLEIYHVASSNEQEGVQHHRCRVV